MICIIGQWGIYQIKPSYIKQKEKIDFHELKKKFLFVYVNEQATSWSMQDDARLKVNNNISVPCFVEIKDIPRVKGNTIWNIVLLVAFPSLN